MNGETNYQPRKPRKEGGGMSKQPEAPDELDQIFYKALRGKTVTPEQAHILEWAEARLKPALLAREERLAKKILDDLESEMNLHELSGSPDDSYIQGLNATCRVVQWVFDRKRKQLTNPIEKEKQS